KFTRQYIIREYLVVQFYMIMYGSVNKVNNLVIIDESMVRGTTIKKIILAILNRLSPKKIIVVSSAPQIRYPDCYGIDMAKLEDFIAFRAALELHKANKTMSVVDEIYQKCISQVSTKDVHVINHVKEFYAPFSTAEISQKIGELLSPEGMKAEVQIIYQTIEDLHDACPKNLGDWYFTGNYPTPGGNRVVNRAFINFYEGKNERAY
ncbi:MAG: amidophosphoribosyltransferase, partial [Flavobacteriaceae bacterium]